MKTDKTKEFIAKAKAVHGDKYDYSKVNYVKNTTKVTIICKIHGEFEQSRTGKDILFLLRNQVENTGMPERHR